MNQKRLSLIRRILGDQRGQIIPWVALSMTMMLGMGGFVVDMGHAFFCYRELQTATDAAALAAAQSLPSSYASTVAATYGAVSGGDNAIPGLTGVTMETGYPLLKCLTTLKNEGMACVAPADANAIQVKETASVPTYFVSILGIHSVTISTTATASMRGSTSSPYNVAIIVDTTASMSDTDSDSQCNSSRLSCALAGVQTLLSSLSPCGSGLSTCGSATNGNVTNSVDRVSLFTFPNMTVGTASKEYDCSSSNPTIPAYSLPGVSSTSYAPTGSSTATYQVLPYQSDYRSSDSATSLVSGSNLVKSVGGSSGCTGMEDPGGDGTYYAGVVYAAQASLVAEQAANHGSQNVMIIISDGDANADQSKFSLLSLDGLLSLTGLGTYPSYNDQCGQAVTAAKAATAAGTRVYTVAYGAEASGCSTDTSGFSKGYTPCDTMENMASAPQYFFSDYTQSGSTGSCISASQPTSNLNQIFTEIAGDLTVARLIPDDTP